MTVRRLALAVLCCPWLMDLAVLCCSWSMALLGQRSSNRDLECQIAVVTDDAQVGKALHKVRVTCAVRVSGNGDTCSRFDLSWPSKVGMTNIRLRVFPHGPICSGVTGWVSYEGNTRAKFVPFGQSDGHCAHHTRVLLCACVRAVDGIGCTCYCRLNLVFNVSSAPAGAGPFVQPCHLGDGGHVRHRKAQIQAVAESCDIPPPYVFLNRNGNRERERVAGGG